MNNNGYTHFAVSKTSSKIVDGWDYSGYEPSELKQFKKDYFIDDLIGNGFNPKDIRILTLKGLKREGIDPNDDSNWSQGIENMNESTEGDDEETIDLYNFYDILDNCGWGCSNSYDVENKSGERGIRFEINAHSQNACPFKELVNQVKSVSPNPNKIIPSIGRSSSAPELSRQSIIILY